MRISKKYVINLEKTNKVLLGAIGLATAGYIMYGLRLAIFIMTL